jgi:hypothetical protein
MEKDVKRFQALFRDTWWLWLGFGVAATALSIFSPIFLVTFPICLITFIRFAFVQYDEEGNFISN